MKNIKKYITLFILLLSLSFNQTGVATPEGESAMGVWGNIAKGVDCGDFDCKEFFGAGMSYIMDNGMELGINYLTRDIDGVDIENTEFYFQYHFKNLKERHNISVDSVPNIAIGLGKNTYTVSDDYGYHDDTDFTILNCMLYGDNLFSFSYKYYNHDDSNSKAESILFGKLWNLNSFYLNTTYEIPIYNGKFSDLLDDLDDGIMLIGIGVTF